MQLKPPPVSLLDAYTGTDVLRLYTTRVGVAGGAARQPSSPRAKADIGSADRAGDQQSSLPFGTGGIHNGAIQLERP